MPPAFAGDEVSSVLWQRLQQERSRLGLHPLSFHPLVQDAAQTLADDVTRRGDWRGVDLSVDRVVDLLAAEGYFHKNITSVFYVGGTGPADAWVDHWLRKARDTFDQFHEPEMRHVGIGKGDVLGSRFYYLVISVSATDYLNDEFESLGSVEEVRARVRDQVNLQRRKKKLPPLVVRAELTEAAQSYAEAMLKRGFYGHVSPDGGTVRDRVSATGYRPVRVAENLASGQTRVEQVMAGWMDSPGHRANILHRHLKEIGVGVARGQQDGEPKIVWVQVFAGPR